jgi:hypothetical protein
LESLLLQCLNHDGQTIEVDKALGIHLVVVALVKGGNVLGIEGIWRGDPCIDHIALVELQFHASGDVLLGYIDKSGEGLPQRSIPLSVVNELPEGDCQAVFLVQGVLIERKGFQHLMGVEEDGSAGGLVYAAAVP